MRGQTYDFVTKKFSSKIIFFTNFNCFSKISTKFIRINKKTQKFDLRQIGVQKFAFWMMEFLRNKKRQPKTVYFNHISVSGFEPTITDYFSSKLDQ